MRHTEHAVKPHLKSSLTPPFFVDPAHAEIDERVATNLWMTEFLLLDEAHMARRMAETKALAGPLDELPEPPPPPESLLIHPDRSVLYLTGAVLLLVAAAALHFRWI